MTDEKALATIEGQFKVVEPLVSADEAKHQRERYQALVRAIVGPKDIQTFTEDGKKVSFIKKSGWRALAVAFGFTIEQVNERIFHKHDKATCLRVLLPDKFGDVVDCGCNVTGARYLVRVTAPNGRAVEAVGLATFNEKRARYTRVEHDLAGKAYTRAVNRAISDMVGAGEPSAEEAAQAEHVGLPAEDQREIGRCWQAASDQVKAEALDKMREMGFKGEDKKALFSDFNRRADGDQVNVLLQALGYVESFDPDDVPLEPAEEAKDGS